MSGPERTRPWAPEELLWLGPYPCVYELDTARRTLAAIRVAGGAVVPYHELVAWARAHRLPITYPQRVRGRVARPRQVLSL